MTVRTFDPQGIGTSVEAWSASPLATTAWLAGPGAGDRVVVVAAHPDDETLGAGGLLAATAAGGADVTVVVATDGEASHPDSPTHDPMRLAAVRRDETRAALAALGAGIDLVWLGLPDGRLGGHLDALTHLLRPHLATATHAVSTWSGDGHPDHEACGTVTARLAAERPGTVCWQYPVWVWHWGDPAEPDVLPWPRVRRVPLGDAARDAKRAAVAAYRSQHSPLSEAPGDETILPAHVLAHFDRAYETFVVVAPAAEPAYFDALYEAAADPWDLGGRFYEQRKRDVLLASLPRRTFDRAFEPGCATGELTVRLAERCREVLALDSAAAAVEQAAGRVPAHVSVRRGRIPDDWPPGPFDLVVLSEVGYYSLDLDETVRRLRSSLADSAVVVACHWRHPAPDHPLTGDEVHAALATALSDRFTRLVRHEEDDFLLDVWSADPRSVAAVEGLLG